MTTCYRSQYYLCKMPSKDKIRQVLKEHYGDFDSYLEIEYENKLNEIKLIIN